MSEDDERPSTRPG